MAVPLILAGVSAAIGLAGMGVDIANSLKAEEANLAEVEAQRKREALKLRLESEQRAADLARGVGIIDTAAAAAGVSGGSVGVVRGTEIASGIRSQQIAELNFAEQMRQLDFAAQEIERQVTAERLGAIMGGLSTSIGATQGFISDREVK